MRTRTLFKSAVAGALAAGGLAVAASGASASSPAGATTLPSSALGTIVPGPPGGFPSGGPGVKVTGTCPAWLFSDPAGVTFSSGNAVLYQPDNSGIPGLFGLPPFDGGNVQGNATLADVADSTQASYTGQAHLWYGLTYSPAGNQQFYFGETLSFRGSGPAGSISLSANPGFTVSASGHNSGWGQFDLRCS